MKKNSYRPRGWLEEAVRSIRSRLKLRPEIGVILGSGLGDFAEGLSGASSILTESIPHYPRSTVSGHRGRLVAGMAGAVPLLAFQGRVHYYETGTIETVLTPIRVAHALGIHTLIVTNAAGGINARFAPGDLMLIDDQINFTFESPVGIEGRGLRNVDCYDEDLRRLAVRTARANGIPLRRGVYLGLKGPTYETAAEVRMARILGADAVGMSTVNEVSLAVALGLKVVGLSCITNLATGISREKLSHADVTVVANKVRQRFADLLEAAVAAVGAKSGG